MPTRDNTGRKYHWWETTTAIPGGDLEEKCRHCRLVRISEYDVPRPRFQTSKGKPLNVKGTPDCPRTATY